MKKEISLDTLILAVALLLIASATITAAILIKRTSMELTGHAYAEARVCVNKGPLIFENCSHTVRIGESYNCDVDATDPNNDSLIFYDNTSWFDIDPASGLVIFMPNMTGSILAEVFVDDGKGCNNSVAHIPLSIDVLPITSGGGGGGGAGGGAGGAYTKPEECTPQWQCGPWTGCDPSNKMTRLCRSINGCLVDKPIDELSCIYIKPIRLPPQAKYLCNLDMLDECRFSTHQKEDWVFTLFGTNHSLSIMDFHETEISIETDEMPEFISLKHIKGMNINDDSADDIEFILHSLPEQDRGKADITLRRARVVRVVIERPVYPETRLLPEYIYENACVILLSIFICVSILIFYAIVPKRRKGNPETIRV